MLTIFIIPSGATNVNFERTIKSIRAINMEITVVKMKDFGIAPHVVKTPFYGYIYDNEYFSQSVIEAIPVFLSNAYFDCLVFFKKVEDHENVFRASRIFKEHVKLNREEGFLPVGNPDDYKWEVLLDGFIKEDART